MYTTKQLIKAISKIIDMTNNKDIQWKQEIYETNDKSLNVALSYKFSNKDKNYYISKINTKTSYDGEYFYDTTRLALHITKNMPIQDVLIYEYHDDDDILQSLYESAQNSIAINEDALGDFLI